MSQQYESILAVLKKHQQEHILAGYANLEPQQQEKLLGELAQLDFESLDDLISQYVRQRPMTDIPTDLAPAPYYPLTTRSDDWPDSAEQPDYYHRLGSDAVRQGKLAAFTVAGGQGTRLGWNGPKGTYPATVVTGKPLFQCFAEQILAAQEKYDVHIPWYIMTSPLNDATTQAFFIDNNYFGLSRNDVFMFPQGILPSFDAATGRLLLAEADTLAVNPNGHGGSIQALRESGAVEDMIARGIEHISYFQIDNPLVNVIDPLFLGLHLAAPDSSAEMSSKMVPKTDPEEKVGVFCQSAGKTMVIEYSDLPDQYMHQRDEQEKLLFLAGSIAIHLISVSFVEKLTADSKHFALPYHRADKKVPHVDPQTGDRIEPKEPNGVKLEAFVFDAIPLAESSIVMETSRESEFAPIKNAQGTDSPATSHQLQSDRAGTWLESVGISIPRDSDGHVDALLEISPLTALHAEDLDALDDLPSAIKVGEELAI